jgi:hypothetical protein
MRIKIQDYWGCRIRLKRYRIIGKSRVFGNFFGNLVG